jgi:hypothetical protein
MMCRFLQYACLSVVVLAGGACAGLAVESGHPCPCEDGYACCENQCVLGTMCKATRDGEADGFKEASLDRPSPDAFSDSLPDASSDGPRDTGLADVPDGGEVVKDSGESDACGASLSWVPSGGILASDLEGCGLISLTLAVADGGAALTDAAGSEADAGDASPRDAVAARDAPSEAGDGGDAGPIFDPNPADTLVNVDTGEITWAGTILRHATTEPSDTRDVQEGIGYRINENGVAVFSFYSLNIPHGTTLKLFGTHPVAIASATTMTIDGILEARPMSADGTICAPASTVPTQTSPGDPNPGATGLGGYAGGNGGNDEIPSGGLPPSTPGSGYGGIPGLGGGSAGILFVSGGGGGGHAGVGGYGAVQPDGGVLAPGGSSYDNQSLDAQNFHGGAGGGGGGGGNLAWGGAGGSGGGAVRVLAATSIAFGRGSSYGGIDASGCGGAPGVRGDGVSASGGGGAGGAIVIESPTVTLEAHASLLTAGGGGGVFGVAGGTVQPSDLPAFGHSPSIGDSVPAPNCQVPWPVDAGPVSWTNPDGVPGDSTPTGGNYVPTGCAGGGATGWILINTAGGTGFSSMPTVILAPSVTGLRTDGALTTP